MQAIQEACANLDVAWLPERIGDFHLVVDQAITATKVYSIFHYENEQGWRWEVQYDKEVGDYEVRVSLSLLDFVDINFSRSSMEAFWTVIKNRTVQALESRFVNPQIQFTLEFKESEVPTWDYAKVLPPRVGDFRLTFKPSQSMPMINGSFIIGEYVKEGEKTGIILFYNVFRKEFFSETRVQGKPGITHVLDGSSLAEFERHLEHHLESVLSGLEG